MFPTENNFILAKFVTNRNTIKICLPRETSVNESVVSSLDFEKYLRYWKGTILLYDIEFQYRINQLLSNII